MRTGGVLFMEKKIAGLLGAVAALSTIGTAQATPAPAPTDALQANTYAELLEPIPNALALLQTVDAQAPAKSTDANVQVAQLYYHHHHHGYFRYGPVVVVPHRHWHHHHHHHHHHAYYRY
jgi:hypothetical protein